VALISVWYFFISPIFDEINILKEQIASTEARLESKRAEIERLKSYEKQLAELVIEKERLDVALPLEPKKEEILVEIDQLVNKSGMSLENISVAEQASRRNHEEKVEAKEKNVMIKIQTSGSYDALKRLILLAQQDLRLMDVSRINFAPKAEQTSDLTLYEFWIDISTYYY